MTLQEKEMKIRKVQEEKLKIEKKIASLAIQRDHLLLRLKRLEQIEPKEPKVPTDEERKEQSLRDREEHKSKVLDALKEIHFD